MPKSRYVILVHGDRSPVLLGPMLEATRIEHMRELRQRYTDCGLHALDVEGSGPEQVSVNVKRYEQEENGV